jgi:MFS family permease
MSDRVGKYRLFCWSSVVGIAMVIYYTHLGVTPIWWIIVISVILFASISGRMVAASALNSAMPTPADRGAYMSICSSLQQIAGGAAAMVAGLIVVETPGGHLDRYPQLGWVVGVAMFVAMLLMYRVDRFVTRTADDPQELKTAA